MSLRFSLFPPTAGDVLLSKAQCLKIELYRLPEASGVPAELEIQYELRGQLPSTGNDARELLSALLLEFQQRSPRRNEEGGALRKSNFYTYKGMRFMRVVPGEVFRYLESAVLPTLKNARATHHENFRSAVRHWAQQLGRPPEFSDFSSPAIVAFVEGLTQMSFGRRTTLRAQLIQLWRHAAAAGLAPVFEPPPRERQFGATFIRIVHGEVFRYLNTSFIPDALKNQPGQCHSNFRSAVRCWAKQLGRPPEFRDFSNQAITTFVESLTDMNKSRRNELRKRLVQLWRHAAASGLAPVAAPPPRIGHRQPLPAPIATAGTIAAFYRDHYRPQNLIRACQKTKEDYTAFFRRLETCFGRALLVSEFGVESLAKLVQHLMVEQALADKTVRKHRAMFLALWRHAHDLGLAPQVPRMRSFTVTRNVPDAFSMPEVSRLIAATKRLEDVDAIGGIDARYWWQAILLVCFFTGLRRSTLLRLKRADMDLSRGILTVPGTAMKNGVGKKFQLPPVVIEAVRLIWLPERELLFTPIAAENLTRHFRKLLRLAGIRTTAGGRLQQFHKIRRSTATHLAARAGLHAATNLLGHSDGYVTARYIDESFTIPFDVAALLALPPADDLTAGQGKRNSRIG